jgi:hypothetical protein
MAVYPQRLCCRLLGVEPKTLRAWVQQAQLRFVPHPSDARQQCLRAQDLQQLALLHGRQLPDTVAPPPVPALPPLATDQPPVVALPPLSATVDALRQRVVQLEATVATLQQQLAHLQLHSLASQPQAPSKEDPALAVPGPLRTLHPAEQRIRSRIIPLIEYGAQGRYVTVCPQAGMLDLVPDSPQWFAWLATLPSFRFVGQHGRFTMGNPAVPGGPPAPCMAAEANSIWGLPIISPWLALSRLLLNCKPL